MQGHDSRNESKEGLEKFIVFIMVVLTIFVLFFVYDFLDARATDDGVQVPTELLTSGALACIELGCGPGTDFIGSKEGDVYHECESLYARSILPENRVCFPSATEAVAQGYRKSKV